MGKCDLLEHMRAQYRVQAAHDIEAGLSGGLDSVVLLHLLNRLREEEKFELSAVYVNHGLSANAQDWADFCTQFCRHLNVPLRIERVHINPRGLGIEAAARQARYQAFSDGMHETVALAHHQNDQIETFFLGAARGGGIRAMAAMPPVRALNGATRIWRPLLDCSREELAAYAQTWNLPHIEDESNRDETYLRNWLRHQALPQWEEKIPHFNRRILADIRSMQEELALIDEIAAEDAAKVLQQDTFDLNAWRNLSRLRGRNVLRSFFQKKQIDMPSRKHFLDMADTLLYAQNGGWEWDGNCVQAYDGQLFAYRRTVLENVPNGKTDRLEDILQENGFVLKPYRNGLSESVLTMRGTIRAASGKDVLHLPFGRKSVKKILQENRVLPNARSVWPLIETEDGQCLSVANLQTCCDFQTASGFLPVYEPLNAFIARQKGRENGGQSE